MARNVIAGPAVGLYALVGCVVGGVVGAAGVLIGLLAGRRLRELPRIKCVATDFELSFQKAEPVRSATCSFELDLFNEGQLATGLRGVSVALRTEAGGRDVVARLKDSLSEQPLWAIDLPARRWSHASTSVVFEGEEAEMLGSFRQAYLLGRFPDGQAFELKIVERADFAASPKKTAPKREDHVAERDFRSRLSERRRATE